MCSTKYYVCMRYRGCWILVKLYGINYLRLFVSCIHVYYSLGDIYIMYFTMYLHRLINYFFLDQAYLLLLYGLYVTFPLRKILFFKSNGVLFDQQNCYRRNQRVARVRLPTYVLKVPQPRLDLRHKLVSISHGFLPLRSVGFKLFTM